MRLFGVINASPDSLNTDSIATTPDQVTSRADLLREQGVWGYDLGGQGSTFVAGETSIDEEWERLEPLEKQALLERPSLRARATSLVELLEMKMMAARTPAASNVAH